MQYWSVLFTLYTMRAVCSDLIHLKQFVLPCKIKMYM